MHGTPVLSERRGDAHWITLNDPSKLNAMSRSIMEDLKGEISALQNDPTVSSVVITGTGRAFCAGGDLQEFKESLSPAGNDLLLKVLRHDQELLRSIELLPMPVIAAVNGFAIAGGLELLLCCDIVIAAESAMIGDGHAVYGIIPAGGSTVRLPRKLPSNRASEMLLTGKLYCAKTLEAWGLINLVVADEELHSSVEAVTQVISTRSRLMLSEAKRLARESTRQTVFQGEEAELQAFSRYAHSNDFREGLSAFLEKRKPAFKGN